MATEDTADGLVMQLVIQNGQSSLLAVVTEGETTSCSVSVLSIFSTHDVDFVKVDLLGVVRRNHPLSRCRTGVFPHSPVSRQYRSDGQLGQIETSSRANLVHHFGGICCRKPRRSVIAQRSTILSLRMRQNTVPVNARFVTGTGNIGSGPRCVLVQFAHTATWYPSATMSSIFIRKSGNAVYSMTPY